MIYCHVWQVLWKVYVLVVLDITQNLPRYDLPQTKMFNVGTKIYIQWNETKYFVNKNNKKKPQSKQKSRNIQNVFFFVKVFRNDDHLPETTFYGVANIQCPTVYT